MIHFFQISDTHLGAELTSRPESSSGKPGERFFIQFEKVIDRAIDEKVDFVIHTGDLFNRSKPPDFVRDKTFELLDRCVKHDIPVFLLPGNHERSWIPQNLFNLNHGIKVIYEPSVINFRKGEDHLDLICIPFIRKEARENFLKTLKNLMQEVQPESSILFHHQFIEGAKVGPTNYRFRKSKDVLGRDDLPANILGILGGHVHKHQYLKHPANSSLPIVYCGSIDRVSFAERREPKGFLDVRVFPKRLQIDFISLKPRTMLEKTLVLNEKNAVQRLTDFVNKYRNKKVEGIILLKIKGKIREPLSEYRAYKELIETLNKSFDSVRLKTNELRVIEDFNIPESFFLRPKINVKKYENYVREFSVDQISQIPETPGVYLFSAKNRKTLYIGKSRHLRQRVRSHFYSSPEDKPWIRDVKYVKTFFCGSELEALYLESQMIKKLKPAHNRQLLKYNNYVFLKYSSSRKKPFSIVEEITDKHAKYWGPFSSHFHVNRAFDILVRKGICSTSFVERTISLFNVNNFREPVLLKEFLDNPLLFRDEILAFTGASLSEEESKEISGFVNAIERLYRISRLTGVIIQPAREGEDYAAWFIIYQGRLVAFWNIPKNNKAFNNARYRAIRLFTRLDKNREKSTNVNLFVPPLFKKELDEILITHRWIKYSKTSGFIPLIEFEKLTSKQLL